MKTRLLFLLLLFSSFQFLQGKIWTVDNKPNSSANFTDLQTAIDSASAGDTLMVAGSNDSYGEINVTKKLVLFGAGYKIDNQWGLITQTGSVRFIAYDAIDNPDGDASESVFSGFQSSKHNLYDYSIEIEKCKNITIERCYIPGTIHHSGDHSADVMIRSSTIIKNSIISNIAGSWGGGSNAYRSIITNSIIKGDITNLQPTSEIIIDHCLFAASQPLYYNSSYLIISNSIFYNAGIINCSYITFSNNLSFGNSNTEFIFSTNTGGNNLVNVNPQFNKVESAFSFDDDYRLKPGSPAIGAASDGTDIGIYGGSFPFPIGGEGEFLMAAPPRIPQIMEMNIQNATVPENGTLKVVLKARKGN